MRFDLDGSLAPVIIRLAWHASGTYDKDDKTGGSNYATMRFEPESKHGANNGLVSLHGPHSVPLDSSSLFSVRRSIS